MSDLSQSLINFLEEQEEKEFVPNIEDGTLTEEEIKNRFKITSKDQANYYVRKVKELDLEAAAIRETAEKELKRVKANIEAWQEKELKKLDYPRAFFANLLQEYAQEALEGAKKQTLSLPNGSIGFKKQQAEFKYDDSLLVSALAGSKYEQLQTISKINKADLKKDISVVEGKAYIEGKLIPGIEVVERGPKFEVK